MSLTSWIWGTSQVDEAIDKATSELLPIGSEDIALNLEICDQIRSKAVQPKDAMRALKRRLNHKNPNVQLLALSLTDTCIKNGGDHFLTEVTGREFMDNLVSILKIPGLNLEVKNKILRYVQNWSVAFEGKPALSYVGQVYKTLKTEGYSFPPQDLAVTSTAMVDTQTAPEWIDSDVCLRCRTPFSFTNRKHHCRNCGQVFDQQCSSKTLPLPHFGITQEVRVCDGCHVKLTRTKKEKSHSADNKYSSHSHRHRSARDYADADLQRAIQLSLAETGVPNGNGLARPGYVPSQPSPSTYKYEASEPPLVDHASRPHGKQEYDDEDDPDLKAAIEASLREASAPKASAPAALESSTQQPGSIYSQPSFSQSYPSFVPPPIQALPNYDLQPLESDAILTFSQAVQHVEAEGGRDVMRYPAVTELYDKANGLRPKLAMSLDDTDKKEKLLAEMNDKLSHAVKLYDKLLTEQLSQPSWRNASASGSQYAPYRYNTVDGSYNTQWNPAQASPQQAGYAQQPQYMPHQPQQIQYNAQPASQQQQYYGNPAQQSPPNQVQHYETTMYPPMSQYSQPMNVPQQQSAQSPPPQSAPSQPVYTQPPPQPNLDNSYQQPLSQQQIQSSPQYAPVAEPSSTRTESVTYDSSMYTAQPAPVQPASVPILTQVQASEQAFSPPPRQQSLSVSSQPLQPIPTAPSQHQHQFQPQQPPQPTYTQPAPQPAQQMPQFPTVPSSNPQSFSMYGPPVQIQAGMGPGFEQVEERKEALLIDL